MSHVPSHRIMRSGNLPDDAKARHCELVHRLNASPSPALVLASFIRTAHVERPEDLKIVADMHVRATANRSSAHDDREGFTQLMEALAPTPLLKLAPISATHEATRWLMRQATYLDDEADAQQHMGRVGRLAAALQGDRTHSEAISKAVRKTTPTLMSIAPHRVFTLLAAIDPASTLHAAVARTVPAPAPSVAAVAGMGVRPA